MRIIVKVPDGSTYEDLTLFMNCANRAISSLLKDDGKEKGKDWCLRQSYSFEPAALSGNIYAITQPIKTGYRVSVGWEKEAIA